MPALKLPSSKKLNFYNSVRKHLRPLFPQATIEYTQPKNSKLLAALEPGGNAMRLQLSQTATHAVLLRRPQLFTAIEQQTATAFVKVFGRIQSFYGKPYWTQLAQLHMNKVVALAASPTASSTVELAIERFLKWSQETYEGQRISCAVGVLGANPEEAHGLRLSEYLKHDLAKVVSDGHSSIVLASSDGKLAGYRFLGSPDAVSETFAPLAYSPMAKWADNGRVAIALTRSGDILIFRLGVLMFAKRRGSWSQFSHEAVVKQMARGQKSNRSIAVRRAAYLTALDVSFARTGGALGIVDNSTSFLASGNPLLPQDVIGTAASVKVKAIASFVGKSSFETMDRKLRQELAGIDGATVINHAGRVLAAGAILAVDIGSDGGARKAAAKTLGAHGLGIKISNDGQIEAYSGPASPGQKPIFILG